MVFSVFRKLYKHHYNQFWNTFIHPKETTCPLTVTTHFPLTPVALGKP